MTGKAFRALRRQSLDPRTGEPPTQLVVANLMCVDRNTIARWERGELPISAAMARLAYFVLGREIDIGLLDE